MQKEVHICFVRVTTQVIYPGCVEQRCAALDAVRFMALVQQKLSKVSPALSGDTGTHARLVMSFALLYF